MKSPFCYFDPHGMAGIQDSIDGGTLVPYFWLYFGGISPQKIGLKNGHQNMVATRWYPPPSYKLVHKPYFCIDISTSSTIVVKVMFTNSAIINQL